MLVRSVVASKRLGVGQGNQTRVGLRSHLVEKIAELLCLYVSGSVAGNRVKPSRATQVSIEYPSHQARRPFPVEKQGIDRLVGMAGCDHNYIPAIEGGIRRGLRISCKVSCPKAT